MNHQCSVCKEPAAGFHFGAFTCEGCKSFFGRTYNNPNSVPICKNGGKCEINKKNRTSCKSCRLKKCFSAGMSKSSSRYGRRSNLFKANYSLFDKDDKQNERPRTALTYQSLCSPYVFDDKSDAASITHRTSTNHGNYAANSHNNELLLRNWHRKLQSHLSLISLSTSNQVTSSPVDNQMQQQSPIMHPTLPFVSNQCQSFMGSLSRNVSDSDLSLSDDDRILNMESNNRNCSSQVSALTLINRMGERTSSDSNILINGSLMVLKTHNPHFNELSRSSIPVIIPATCSARGGDSILVSPNPGGLADELDEQPIDLSMRGTGSSSEEEKREKKEDDQINDSDNSSREESAANPLDLTLDASPKSLTSASRS